MSEARTGVWVSIVLVAAATWAHADRAEAAEIKVLSAGAVRSVVSDLAEAFRRETGHTVALTFGTVGALRQKLAAGEPADVLILTDVDRKSTRLNSSHSQISYAVFCLKKKKYNHTYYWILDWSAF